MLLNKMEIQSLIDGLRKNRNIMKHPLCFFDAELSEFSLASPGYAIWRWDEVREGERLKESYLFSDEDGAGVFVSIVADYNNNVTEIEFWRGDGESIKKVPDIADLEYADPGTIY